MLKNFRRWSVSFLIFFYSALFDSVHSTFVSPRSVYVVFSGLIFFLLLFEFFELSACVAFKYSAPKSRLATNKSEAHRKKTTAFDFLCVFSKRNLCNLLWYSFVGIIPNKKKQNYFSSSTSLSIYRLCHLICMQQYSKTTAKKKRNSSNSNKTTSIKQKIYRSLRINQ